MPNKIRERTSSRFAPPVVSSRITTSIAIASAPDLPEALNRFQQRCRSNFEVVPDVPSVDWSGVDRIGGIPTPGALGVNVGGELSPPL